MVSTPDKVRTVLFPPLFSSDDLVLLISKSLLKLISLRAVQATNLSKFRYRLQRVSTRCFLHFADLMTA